MKNALRMFALLAVLTVGSSLFAQGSSDPLPNPFPNPPSQSL